MATKAELNKLPADEVRKRAAALDIEGADSNNKEENIAAIVAKETANVSEGQMDAVSEGTGLALKEQPKKTIKLYQVPPGSTDNQLPDEVVCINGYVYQIQRGVEVEVPESVAQVLADAGRV